MSTHFHSFGVRGRKPSSGRRLRLNFLAFLLLCVAMWVSLALVVIYIAWPCLAAILRANGIKVI